MLASTLLLAGVLASAWPDSVTRGVAEWEPEGLGNHRFVVEVKEPAPAVHVEIRWRRRDAQPELKDVVVTAANGERVARVLRGNITREAGEFTFEPAAGAGLYSFYYMPYTTEGTS